MAERLASFNSNEVDPNSSEKITQEVMGPDGAKFFGGVKQGESESARFRITEEQLLDGTFAESFFVSRNEEGDWVVVSDNPEEEPWRIPKGVEFSFGIGGTTMRAQDQTQVLPFNPNGESSPIPGRLAQQARDAGAGHPNLSLYSYDAKLEDGDQAVLLMANLGREDVPLEVHKKTEVLPDESQTQQISARDIAALDPRTEEHVAVQEVLEEPEVIVRNEFTEDKDHEGAAVDKLTEEAETLADEDKSVAGASLEDAQNEVDTETTAEYSEPALLDAEPSGKDEKEDPLAELPSSLRTAVRLGSITIEEAFTQAAADEQKKQDELAEEARRQERLALDRKLTLAEAADQIVSYAADRMGVNDKAVHEAIHDPEGGLLALMRKASRQNESIEGSGVLEAIARLRSKVAGYSEDFNDLHKQVREYIGAGEHNRDLERALEVIAGNKTEESKARDETVDAMETLRDDLEAARAANDGVLEYLGGLEADLTNGVPTTYVNQPSFSFGGAVDSKAVLVREALEQGTERLKNMGEYMSSERDVTLQKVRSAISALEAFGDEAKKQA